MDVISYIDILRRRWILVGACVALAIVAVWVTLPQKADVSAATTSYRATATLALAAHGGDPPNLARLALYATVGEVPAQVKERLHAKESPLVLASKISTRVNPETETITISTEDPDGATAVRTANTFSEELMAYLERSERREAKAQLDALKNIIDGYTSQLSALDAEIAAGRPRSTLEAERDGLEAAYQSAVTQAADLQSSLVARSPLEMLQKAEPVPQVSGGFSPPSGPRSRLLIGAGLGFGLGFVLALLMERVDSRLRTREQVEGAFRLPVLAEIPGRPWLDREDLAVASASEPGGATAEAYRALRSAVLLMTPDKPTPTNGLPSGRRHPEVILVTSASAGEGKTSTVVNLAVVMAETGRRVLILSLDLRNPSVDAYFDVGSAAGISDLLSANHPRALETVVRDTDYPDVQIAAAGTETGHPGALLAGVGPLIQRARKLADVVIIDSAPLLAVSDAVDISPHVDAALIVVRTNRATTENGRAAHRLLSRMGVPALGAVLVGRNSSTSFDSYPARLPRSDAQEPQDEPSHGTTGDLSGTEPPPTVNARVQNRRPPSRTRPGQPTSRTPRTTTEGSTHGH